MLNRLIEPYQGSGLSQVVVAFRDAGIRSGTEEALVRTRRRLSRARRRTRRARAQGHVRLWSFETDTLEQICHVLSDSPAQPFVRPLHQVVERRLQQQVQIPVDAYDTLNVKKVAHAVNDLGLVDLERIARHEKNHKNRKTVFRSIARRQSQILDPVNP